MYLQCTYTTHNPNTFNLISTLYVNITDCRTESNTTSQSQSEPMFNIGHSKGSMSKNKLNNSLGSFFKILINQHVEI